jgi:hypothetical protein
LVADERQRDAAVQGGEVLVPPRFLLGQEAFGQPDTDVAVVRLNRLTGWVGKKLECNVAGIGVHPAADAVPELVA